jgi:membrane protease YdiL (CAAX protease family)
MTAALVFRAWLQMTMLQRGVAPQVAADLSYLVVPPTLIVLLLPIWRTERSFVARQFRLANLTCKVVITGIGIGVMLRLLWWAQLVAGVSFGVYASDSQSAVGPTFAFSCPGTAAMALGMLTMVLLTPVIEEVIHRAYIINALRPLGRPIAILGSAAVFAIFHRSGTWVFVCLAGVVFAWLYWYTQSLWLSLIAHATFNGLTLLDWRCLTGQWNPRAADIPLMETGITALAIMLATAAALVATLYRISTGANNRPGKHFLKER